MRPYWLFSMLVACALALSGCADDKDDPCDDGRVDADCPENTATGTGTTTTTNTTTGPPNVPPTLSVTVTDDGGNETTTVMAGGNLTFSATGSADTDGVIENIAVTVTDKNRTKGETKQLFNDGRFLDATFGFPDPGRSTAFVAMVDDDSGFATEEVAVYVNHEQDLGSFLMRLTDPVGSATACAGSAANDIADAQYYKEFTFETHRNASFVEATVATGSAKIAICSPDGEPVSAEATDTVVSDAGTVFTASLDGYYVAAVSQAPNQEVGITVVVHYEPDERSA